MSWKAMDPARRSRIIDALAVVGAAALSVAAGYANSAAAGDPKGVWLHPGLTSFMPLSVDHVLPPPLKGHADLLVPLVGSVLLWWRRRWPVPIAVVLMFLSISWPLLPAALVALFTVAATRTSRTTFCVTAFSLLPFALYFALHPYLTDVKLSITARTGGALVVVLVGAAVGWGLFLRVLHESTEHARTEAVLRADQVRQRERESLAREMHDVLAHRLSLLSVHAGALEVNPGAPADQVGQAAAVIRSSAHQALEDLQEVLGVLRAPLADTTRSEPPQPVLADLAHLVQESRTAGMRIDLDESVPDKEAVPMATGRTAYRIVQEALTNARKHAPGQPVTITVHGTAGTGLALEVTNPVPEDARPRVPGSELGLIGLQERTALVGGALTYGLHDGTHRIRARLPWPA
ncbi:sensor histidine kinase [Streptomyces sp. NPDC018045]|uniref:sensor histidine kinase n=1 Tax=Streptomyces sp. NPDC018045 TaxID=3365037 RepID=UPI0037A037EC